MLERAVQTPIPEIIVRGYQEASKWLDRMASVSGRVRWARRAGPRNVAVLPACLFEGAADISTTVRLFEQISEGRAQTISAANRILQNQFDLLGYRSLDCGDPIDWHQDPVSRRRAPLVHWSRLDPLNAAAVGDSKVVWELNRHQWLLYLGQAYQFTGNERYAEAFARAVREWMQANPPGMGINWASSLEVALRLISWCWALMLFEGSQALSTELFAKLVGGIEAHARHVERYLSHYFSPNTHLTGEALGLFYAGVLFPDLRRARRWRMRGAEILVQQCDRQILPDGVYFEQSTCYQRYTAEIYLHFLILAARNGVDVPEIVASRLQQLLDFLIAVRRPDGSMPQIGDADGGWLLSFLPRAPDDLRGVFSIAAAVFGRSDYAWVAGGLTPEILWLLGPAGADAFQTLVPAAPRTAPSQIFPYGGHAVMRSEWGQDAHQLIFDFGPLGCSISGAHGHADLLSIQCAAFGEPYLVDAGTYCYAPHLEWRDHFRSTSAHSTVRVDDREQAVPAGLFKWQTRPRARLRRWLSTEALDFADAEHDAFHHLPGRVRHRRRVLFVRPRYWVVVDDLDGEGGHRVEVGFQFAPIEVSLRPDSWAQAVGRTGCALLIRPFATVALEAKITEGEYMPIRGWASPDYGRLDRAPILTYSVTTVLPLRIATLVLPTADPHAATPRADTLLDEASRLAGFSLWGDREHIRFDDDGEINVVLSDPMGPGGPGMDLALGQHPA